MIALRPGASDDQAAFGAFQGGVMASHKGSALVVVLAAALQGGCAEVPRKPVVLAPAIDVPRAACDTSVKILPLVARFRNTTGATIVFNLEGNHAPPLDPWYMGYRVHSGGPGQPFGLVHNSGHDSVWTNLVAIAPGEAVDFNVPIFGLRPEDYRHWFVIEMRDSKARSYWTGAFDLCSVPKPICGCPPPGGLAIGVQGGAQACPLGAANEQCH
jgi:hypothetical protein